LGMVETTGISCNTCHRGAAHPEAKWPEMKMGPGGPGGPLLVALLRAVVLVVRAARLPALQLNNNLSEHPLAVRLRGVLL
jgi:hypothetical protein